MRFRSECRVIMVDVVQESNREQPSHHGFLVSEAWWKDRAAGRVDSHLSQVRRYDDMLAETVVRPSPWADLQPGGQFGDYQIERLAGRGDQATVYRAGDLRLGRTVALKILQPRGDGWTRPRSCPVPDTDDRHRPRQGTRIRPRHRSIRAGSSPVGVALRYEVVSKPGPDRLRGLTAPGRATAPTRTLIHLRQRSHSVS